jgi:hypothetical protein
LTIVHHTNAFAKHLKRLIFAEYSACSGSKGIEYNFALRAVKHNDGWDLGMGLVKLAQRGHTTHGIVIEFGTDDNRVRQLVRGNLEELARTRGARLLRRHATIPSTACTPNPLETWATTQGYTTKIFRIMLPKAITLLL